MSQYYSQQQPPYYPPPTNPEEDYYEDYEDYEVEEQQPSGGDSCLTRGLIFAAGGCLTLLCLTFCGITLAGLWILDPGSSLLSTPVPGSEVGLTFEEPAAPDETVVNEQGVRLSLVEVNRNASSNTIPDLEGAEIIVVTIQLENLGDENANYDDARDFKILNQTTGFYEATPGAIEGALGFGTLTPEEGLQGRLIFQVIEGEQGLILEWNSEEGTPRYIELQ